jgi:two-component system, NarL family, nitrate/nitrite response regulator NarL
METAANTALTARTCVVADDHPPILDAVSRYLGSLGVEVVATARDGESALAAVLSHRPQVCLADVRMPRLDGLELARRVATAAPDTAVLLYSGVSDAGLVSDALDAGARGFALKDAPLEDLARALETVATGGLYVDPVLAATIATSRRGDERRALSAREREVLRMLAEGGSYAEIGSTLFLSPDTIRAHAQRAMTKLGARTRTQAVAVAMRDALIA